MPEREVAFRPSTNIKRILYDPDTLTLTVHLNGGVYQYNGVSEETAQGFETADSAGQYHHAFVKHQHEYKKIG